MKDAEKKGRVEIYTAGGRKRGEEKGRLGMWPGRVGYRRGDDDKGNDSY